MTAASKSSPGASSSDAPYSGARGFLGAYAGCPVLVTGHTGFTGGWLSLWLGRLGADVTGLSLAPLTTPNLFEAASVASGLTSHIGNIQDAETVLRIVDAARPKVIFHLAAQPLVSQSFADPLETFRTNVIGTANVLEAARQVPGVEAVVCVTTDKVYGDQQFAWGYREVDALGGKDPYSASKACAELVAASYSATLTARGNGVKIATARGGNIIGGGDWSENRIVPDFVRAVTTGTPLTIRHPEAVRPWQHVLALAHGYLTLAARLMTPEGAPEKAWNFGPAQDAACSVGSLLELLQRTWSPADIRLETGAFPETNFLNLDSTRARRLLGWHPPIDLEATIRLTTEWYRRYAQAPGETRALTLEQIAYYESLLED